EGVASFRSRRVVDERQRGLGDEREAAGTGLRVGRGFRRLAERIDGHEQEDRSSDETRGREAAPRSPRRVAPAERGQPGRCPRTRRSDPYPQGGETADERERARAEERPGSVNDARKCE